MSRLASEALLPCFTPFGTTYGPTTLPYKNLVCASRLGDYTCIKFCGDIVGRVSWANATCTQVETLRGEIM